MAKKKVLKRKKKRKFTVSKKKSEYSRTFKNNLDQRISGKEEARAREKPLKKAEKKPEKRQLIQIRKRRLRYYLDRAGIDTDPHLITKKIFNLCVLITLIISAFLIYHFYSTLGFTLGNVVLIMLALWVPIFLILLALFWIIFYFILDLKIFKRKSDIEEVLPDFLQLTASNIKAGMTVDRAMWYSIRPKFGVLAKEIETVAKETMGGEDLRAALENFANKFDSLLLKRSISLLIEGIDAGGEIGDLLNRIALNIQEIKTMRKEMASNVTAYTIFITFATVLAGPFLFGLSGVLIRVVKSLGSSLSTTGASTGALALSFSGSGISYSDFRIFVIVSIVITSFFSASIVATIRKGDIKTGVKYIPMFIAASIVLFLIAELILGGLFGTLL